MILIELKCKHFRQYKKLAHTFPSSGIIAVVGENEVGKSTLQEMLGFALFGSVAFRTTVDEVLSYSASDDVCEVEMRFKVGDTIYQLKRGFKGKNHTAYASLRVADSDGKALAENPKAVDSEIKRIFGGIDHKIFYNTYCVKQKELDSLSSMVPSERKKFILKMLRIDVIDVAIKDIRKAIIDMETKIGGLENLDDEIADVDSQLGKIGDKIAEIGKEEKEKSDRYDSGKKELESLEKKYEEVVAEYNKFTTSFNQCEFSLSEVGSEISFIKKEKKEVGEKIKANRELKKDVVELPPLEEKYESLIKMAQTVKELDKKKTNLRDVEGVYKKLLGNLDDNRDKLEDRKKKMSDINAEMDEYDVKKIEDKLEEIKEKQITVEKRLGSYESDLVKANKCIALLEKSNGEAAQCSQCGSMISDIDHFRGEADILIKNIEGWKEKSIKAKTIIKNKNEQLRAYDDLSRRLGLLKKEVDGIEDSILDIENRVKRDSEYIAKIKKEVADDENNSKDLDYDAMDELKKQIDYQKYIQAKLKSHKELVDKYKGFEERLIGLEKRYGEIEEDLRYYNDMAKDKQYEDMISDSRKNIGFKKNGVNELNDALNEVRMIKVASVTEHKSLVDKKCEMEEKKKSVMDISNEILKHSKLVNYMVQFKTSMIGQITPKLSEMLSDFVLNASSRYSVVKLNDNYDILVEMDGQERPLEVLSGGAIDLVNACLRFAISRYLNESYGSLMSMIFMDEIFASQDANRRRNLIAVMQNLKNIYKQIIVITHVNDVMDYVDEVIVVERDPVNGSYIK